MTSAIETRIKTLLDIVVSEGGSDLHLSAGSHPIIRVSGSLVPLLQQPPLTSADTSAILEAMVPKERMESFVTKQSVDFSYGHTEKSRFRVY